MGYGGSVLHMITTLRNNKSLSRRPKAFSKLREQINQQTDKKRFVLDKKASPEELAKIRKEIIQQIRIEQKRKKKVLLSTISLSTILLLVFIKLAFFSSFNFSMTYKPKERTTTKKLSTEEKAAKLIFSIEDGQKWLNENHFNNAIYQFKLAKEIDPNSYEAQVGLTESYLKKCKLLNEDCEEAKLELDNLTRNFPNRTIPFELD